MWLTGLVAPWHVGSSQTRARTRVPCIGRQILNHCATREAHKFQFLDDFCPVSHWSSFIKGHHFVTFFFPPLPIWKGIVAKSDRSRVKSQLIFYELYVPGQDVSLPNVSSEIITLLINQLNNYYPLIVRIKYTVYENYWPIRMFNIV